MISYYVVISMDMLGLFSSFCTYYTTIFVKPIPRGPIGIIITLFYIFEKNMANITPK